MRAVRLEVRSFRNLADAMLDLPTDGLALIGPNGHGKTNLLEALAYPVLFRSVRGATDREVGQFGGPGFHVSIRSDRGLVATTYHAADRRKRITVDGVDYPTIAPVIGRWMAVGFFPTDLALIQGGASIRRRWLDRMLSLADREYLDALLRYRAALAQRNAALRAGHDVAARAFDPPLAASGAWLVARRVAWAASIAREWQGELQALGERGRASVRYRGDEELAESTAWAERLERALSRDLARGQTHIGPHRDDLVLGLEGRALRHFGSTGQQRSAAIALRLIELDTLERARNERPVLLVDDVFAELDHERQDRLAARLMTRSAQRIVTAPRRDDVPASLELPVWQMEHGTVGPAGVESA